MKMMMGVSIIFRWKKEKRERIRVSRILGKEEKDSVLDEMREKIKLFFHLTTI